MSKDLINEPFDYEGCVHKDVGNGRVANSETMVSKTALRELVNDWRKEACWCNISRASTLDECADQLEALIKENG